MYTVKEIFGPTLQGEGPHAGAPCVFVRLSGCNAWDGRAETRAESACPYCDTDFRGGDRLSADAIVAQASALSPQAGQLGCVLTGGEPLLQADEALLQALSAAFAWVDIETNGTRLAPACQSNVTTVCSPKSVPNQPVVIDPDCWKILIPHQQDFLDQAFRSGKPVYVQPVCPDDGPHGAVYEQHLQRCIELCYDHGCRLSLQQHKYLGLE